jgi:hypothetical protein
MLHNEGGGELTVMDIHGKIVSKSEHDGKLSLEAAKDEP